MCTSSLLTPTLPLIPQHIARPSGLDHGPYSVQVLPASTPTAEHSFARGVGKEKEEGGVVGVFSVERSRAGSSVTYFNI
jgi:hypothetical protein